MTERGHRNYDIMIGEMKNICIYKLISKIVENLQKRHEGAFFTSYHHFASVRKI